MPMHRRGALVLLLLALLPGCTKIAGTRVGDLGELLTMGKARELRHPPRPVRGGERLLVFALDGVGRDALHRAIEEGRMPHVAELLGLPRGGGLFQHGYAAPDVLSILPSTTIPAWSSVFTGAPPAHTAVTGNEWFARTEQAFYAPVPVTVTNRTHAAQLYTDELLSRLLQAPTVYERLPEVRMHVSVSPVYRGADYVTVPELATFGDLFGAVLGESVAGNVQESGRVARETDETAIGSVLDLFDNPAIPDVQTVYFNGIDLLTHYAERPLEDQQRYLAAVTDSLVGKVLRAYREAGVLDRTHVVFVSDHGHTPVLSDDRHSLTARGEDEPSAVLERAGFRLRPLQLTPDRHDYQAVLASQGFMAYVYLADRSTCPNAGDRCDWSRPPRLEEDLLPVVRAFHAASARGEGVPALQGTLDLIFARVPAGTAGEAEVRVFDGERLVPIPEYLRRTPRPDLLRLEERMRDLMIGPHGRNAGDVILLARAGMDRPIEDRFYFGEPQTSEHGSPSAQDSRVPLLVAHPRRSGEELRAVVRRVLGERPSHLHVEALLRELMAGQR